MEGLTEGRIVHYVLPGSLNQCRPAIVVKVWRLNNDGMVNLQVFLDGNNDAPDSINGNYIQWKTSVEYSEERKDGTWHWVEKA